MTTMRENAAGLVGVIVALILVGISLILYTTGAFSGKEKRQPTFLVAGPSYSGKTSLFRKWTRGRSGPTVTSTTSNVYDKLTIPIGADAGSDSGVQYRLVDVPGSAKLGFMERQWVRDNLYSLRGIIFMLDGAGGEEGIKGSASRLYSILEQTEKLAGQLDVLVAANKSDVFNFVSCRRIKRILEDEIEQLRQSKLKGIGDVAQDDGDNTVLGYDDEKFNFDQLETPVSILDGSVASETTHKWESWVEEHALNS